MAAMNVESGGNSSSSDWSPAKVLPEPVMVSSPEDSGTEGLGDGSDNSGGGNACKKPVWNKPSNGVVEVVSPVMDEAWPALGEKTKASPKSSSSESLKALSDGPSPPALQVTGNSSPPQKQASVNNANPTSAPNTSTPNHIAPARQRSMKRGGGANSSANGSVTQPLPATHDSLVENQHYTTTRPATAADSSPRDHKESQRGGFGSQSHVGNDHHHQQRGSFRRGNGGYHHNYGGKRDHDRGNQEWNQHSRSFNNRENNNAHLQSQRGGFSRGYIRPSVHTPATFITPMHVPVQSFANNMVYPDVTSPLIYVSGLAPPFVPPLAPPMYYPSQDLQLRTKIVSQIDYYFSNENLVKDTYLRRNMDEQGWVPVNLIAGFKKVLNLTDNVQTILDAMRTSMVVEVQGDKIRRKNDWMKWIMPAAPVQYSSPQAAGLVSQFQGVTLHEPASANQALFSRSSSGEFIAASHLQQQAGADGTVQVSNPRATVA